VSDISEDQMADLWATKAAQIISASCVMDVKLIALAIDSIYDADNKYSIIPLVRCMLRMICEGLQRIGFDGSVFDVLEKDSTPPEVLEAATIVDDGFKCLDDAVSLFTDATKTTDDDHIKKLIASIGALGIVIQATIDHNRDEGRCGRERGHGDTDE
jgi:hypothetical protein